jgi:hypothetical protein
LPHGIAQVANQGLHTGSTPDGGCNPSCHADWRCGKWIFRVGE